MEPKGQSLCVLRRPVYINMSITKRPPFYTFVQKNTCTQLKLKRQKTKITHVHEIMSGLPP